MKDLDGLFADLFSGDDAIAEKASLTLPEHGLDAVERLSQSLADPHPDNRWWTVRALAATERPEASPLLLQALSDSDQSVVTCALLAMRKRPDLTFVTHLIPLLSSSQHGIPRLAADALIAIGPPATQHLIELVNRPGSYPPSEGVRALANIGDYSAVPSLFRLLDSPNPIIEHWAHHGLEKLSIGMAFFTPD